MNPFAQFGKFILTFFGPVYFGVQQSPLWMVIVWASVCALWLFWTFNRSNKALARLHNELVQEHLGQPGSAPESGMPTMAIVGPLVGLTIAHVAVYYGFLFLFG